ncbi:MAG: energy-coupling factor transporter ATPase [Oscillospiraceae bacterium]|nr:energy-coupling factor transporter ATPase [Candidatus Equicaccousia limihippi]
MSILKTENLSFSYNTAAKFTKMAVKDISFSVESGEIIGVIGHTGSGKSTLMQLLNGLLKPESGKVYFDDADIWENPKEIAKFRFQIGLVFQYPEYQLFEETVYKDIAFAPKNMQLSEEEIKGRVFDSLKSVGLNDTFAEKSPFDLSGGEKRRVAIAGILAMRPKVLILDEPTAGLDPKGRATILNMIKSYRDTTGAAIIIVSHSMEDVASLCDKLLVLSKGEKITFDTTQNVFNSSEQLTKIGLDLPSVTKIFAKLHSLGLLENQTAFTVEEAARIIEQAIKRGAL